MYPIVVNEAARNFCATFGSTGNLTANVIYSDYWVGIADSCASNTVHEHREMRISKET